MEIRKIASKCNFGNALDRMLRDRLGLLDACRKLLPQAHLAHRKAEETACAAEVAGTIVASGTSTHSVERTKHSVRSLRPMTRSADKFRLLVLWQWHTQGRPVNSIGVQVLFKFCQVECFRCH